MITLQQTNTLSVTNANIVDAVIAQAKSYVGISETKTGEHRLEHPFIAFFDILKRLRGQENKAERDAIEAGMVANGITRSTPEGFKAIEDARKSVKSSMENGRVTVAMLRRINGEQVGTGAPIALDAEQQKEAIKALKRSVGGWNGNVDSEALKAILNGLSVVFANARNSSVTALDLGFDANALENFLSGSVSTQAKAIEATSTATDEN